MMVSGLSQHYDMMDCHATDANGPTQLHCGMLLVPLARGSLAITGKFA
jgi:hypothetical protein